MFGLWNSCCRLLVLTTTSVFCPGFQKGRVPSERGTLARWTDRQKDTLARWTDRQKGIISAVNGWKRALLTKSALEWLNKRCTAQSTLCVGNKKGKTELKAMCDWKKKKLKRAGCHFGFFKRVGRHEKVAGRLQKRPRQNTEHSTLLLEWASRTTVITIS